MHANCASYPISCILFRTQIGYFHVKLVMCHVIVAYIPLYFRYKNILLFPICCLTNKKAAFVPTLCSLFGPEYLQQTSCLYVVLFIWNSKSETTPLLSCFRIQDTIFILQHAAERNTIIFLLAHKTPFCPKFSLYYYPALCTKRFYMKARF